MYYSVSKYNKNLLHCKFYGDMMQYILQKNKKKHFKFGEIYCSHVL